MLRNCYSLNKIPKLINLLTKNSSLPKCNKILLSFRTSSQSWSSRNYYFHNHTKRFYGSSSTTSANPGTDDHTLTANKNTSHETSTIVPSLVELATNTTTTPTVIRSEDEEHRLKIIQLEVSVLRQEGRKVPDPDKLKPDHWNHLLQLPSRSSRSKYYTFLWNIEMKKESEKAKKELKRQEGVLRKAQRTEEIENEEHIVYSLSRTSFLLRIYETTMNHWHNNKLTRAMQFNEKLIIDCSYDEHMTKREQIATAKQLMFCFAENRYNDQPFDLHFCNAKPESPTIQYLHRHIPTMYEQHFPINVHSSSYLDLYPKNQLVYLTPHCKTDLLEFNPDDVYIVGAMVDTMNNEPLSLAKAKKQGLRMARLPLDRYLHWGAGSGKSLTLNQMISIMLDLKMGNDWIKALSHVPRRKLFNQEREEKHLRKKWEKSLDRMQGRKRYDDNEFNSSNNNNNNNNHNDDVLNGNDDISNSELNSIGKYVNKFRKTNYQPNKLINNSNNQDNNYNDNKKHNRFSKNG